MIIWLVKTEENLRIDGESTRVARTGMLAEELASRGHHVIFWTSEFNHFKKQYRARGGLIKYSDNLSFFLLRGCEYKKNISLRRISHQRKMARQFQNKATTFERPDLIVVSMPNIDMAYAAFVYAKKRDIPFVVDIRDMWPDNFVDYVPHCLKPVVYIGSLGMRRQLHKLLEGAVGIVATSEKFLEYGLKYARREKTKNDRVFYVGYKKEGLIEKNSIDFFEKNNIDPKKFTCCFFGEFGGSVDIDCILSAAVLLEKEEIQFILCGNGTRLQEYRSKSHGLKTVFFPGWVDKNEIAKISEISSISILPYKNIKQFQMAITNKFVEAMAYRLPILISVDGVMLDMAEKHQFGLMYRNAEELAKHILDIKKNSALRRQMSENAWKLFESSFSASRVNVLYSEYCENIALGDI